MKHNNLLKFIHTNDYIDMVDTLKDNKRNFKVIQTKNTCIIKFDNELHLYTNNPFSKKSLTTLNKFKKYLNQRIINKTINIIDIPHYTNLDIKYFKFGKYVSNLEYDKNINDIVCYDVDMAYPNAMYILGYIDNECLERFKEMDKITRLKTLGGIATTKDVFEFVNGEMHNHYEYSNPLFKRIWFHVSYYVDNVIREFMSKSKDNFIFYWVDGIYLKNNNYDNLINELLEKYKLHFKKENVKYIKKTIINDSDLLLIEKYDNNKNKYVIKKYNVNN